MPPAIAPENVTVEGISSCNYRPILGAVRSNIRIHIDGGLMPFSFDAVIWRMVDNVTSPVVLNGDGCWSYVSEDVLKIALGKGFAVMQFNRCEIARDRFDTPHFDGTPKGDLAHTRDRGIYKVFPGEYGTLSAWAWGYHRAIDAILRIPYLDESRIMITGHSRGGKTVELAAATDERIAIAADNNSGCGGFSCYRVRDDEKAEDCELLARVQPHWFGKDYPKYAGREDDFPFDQHFLAALIAPRALRMQFALRDYPSNLIGTGETYLAAREVYKLLGAEDKINLIYREGYHAHELEDWRHSLEYAYDYFGMEENGQ